MHTTYVLPFTGTPSAKSQNGGWRATPDAPAAAWRLGTGRREALRGQADVATQAQCGLPELNKAIDQRRPENTVMEELGHQPRAWAVGRAE